jgi:two-component system, chemotaxis family, CheB/CheR fusion protein
MAARGRTRKRAAGPHPRAAARPKKASPRRKSAPVAARGKSGQADRDRAAELQHRVNNILATVRAILGQTRDTTTTLEDFVAAFDGRLSALARSQMLLSRGLDGHVDLHELLTDELIAHAARVGESVVVSGPAVWLTTAAAEIMAVAFHELAANAVKYGALATPAGRIDVGWRIESKKAGRRLILRWREDGVRLERSVGHRGFGTELVEEGLPYTFGGAARLHYHPDGLECVMEFPLKPQHFIVVADGAT